MRLLCIILVMTPLGLLSQGKPQVAIHFDRPFYMVGETIHFAIWTTNHQWPPHVQRVEIVSPLSEIKESLFVYIDSVGHGESHIKIPNTWDQGVYTLRVSIFDQSKAQFSELINRPIFLYSDFIDQKLTSNQQEVKSNFKDSLNIDNNTGGLKLECGQEIRVGERNHLTISIFNESGAGMNGNASISVRDRDMAGIGLIGKSSVTRSLLDPGSNPSRFMVYQLQVPDTPGEEDMELIAFDQSEFTSYELESSQGVYELSIVPRRGESVYQFFGKELYPLKTVTVENTLGPSEHYSLPINKRIIESIEANRMRRKIYQWFEIEKNGNLSLGSRSNVPKPSSSYNLDEFDEFESVERFLKEVSTPLKVSRSKKEGIKLRLVNPDDKPFYEGEPVLMVDGIVRSSINELLDIPINAISVIDFYNRRTELRRFDLLGEFGIVSVRTNTQTRQSNPSNSLTLKGLNGMMNYPIEQQGGNALPDFSPLIYWNPNVGINASGKVEIDFAHSDDVGTFEIEVLALDAHGSFKLGHCYYKAIMKD